MDQEWVVLVEAAGDGTDGAINPGEVERLLAELDDGQSGAALHSPKRYALQVRARGSTPVEALVDVVSEWADAVRRLNLPAWKLVRTEVFSPEELEREFEQAHRREMPVGRRSPDRGDDVDDIGVELVRQAFSDPLTGLLGREAFSHRLDDALARRSNGRITGVVSVNLDNFRAVNDRFGAEAGDGVLVAVAERLEAVLRPADTLARLGGVEYAVILEDATAETALAIAIRLREAVGLPMKVGGKELALSASAGVALTQPGDDAEGVVGKAQAALALAKAAGGGTQVLYRSDEPYPARTRREYRTAALQDRLAHLLLMQRAAVAANEAPTLDQAARVVMCQVCAHVGCETARFFVWPDSDEPSAPALWHAPDATDYRVFHEAIDKLSLRPGTGLAGRVIASGRPVWISELAADTDFSPGVEAAVAAGLQSAFAIPVLDGREVVAVLEFFSRTHIEPTGSFLAVLDVIGIQLGRVVERQRAAAAMRRAEEEHRASQAHLRAAQAMARLASWEFDLATGESRWSEGMNALYGFDEGQELDLESALAMVHPDDRGRAEAALGRLVATGEPTIVDIRIVREDGQVRWHHVEGSAIRDESGLVVGIVGTSQDITERKRIEEELRAAKHSYQRIAETAHEGIWTVDAE